MKTLKIALSCFAFIISSVAAQAQFISADLQVSGLTCSMCQLATEKSLKTLDFISEIKPDLNRNIYVLTFKKDKAVNLDMINKKVKDAGFSVSKLVATFNFDNVKINKDFHYKFAGNQYHFIDAADKTLSGPIRLTVLDKEFIPAKDFKKYAALTTFECYKSGFMGDSRVYHVKI